MQRDPLESVRGWSKSQSTIAGVPSTDALLQAVDQILDFDFSHVATMSVVMPWLQGPRGQRKKFEQRC
jgi:hypothetical protein